MDKNEPVYNPSTLGIINLCETVTMVPATDPLARATRRHHNLYPIFRRVEAWEDCRRSLPSLYEKIRRGCSRETAADSPAFSGLN